MIQKGGFKTRRLVLGIASALSLSIASGLCAENADVITLDIESQKAGPALLELAKNANVQIMVPNAIGETIQIREIQGQYTLLDALNIMLDGTGLTYEFRSDESVIIKADSNNAEDADGEKEVDEEIVVTGTLLKNISPTSPTVIIDRDQIERLGASSAEDIIRRLPQNFPALNSASSLTDDRIDRSADLFTAFFNNGAGQLAGNQAADLRGVGVNSTLVLLNGRRVAASAFLENGFFNLSTIPASAIERVEVLLDGASAIYGADAIAGVINIITRKNYESAETSVRYENALNGGNRYTLSQIVGFNWGSGNATMTLQAQESSSVSRFKAGFTTRDFTSLGGPDFSRSVRTNVETAPGTVYRQDPVFGDRGFPPNIIGALPAGTIFGNSGDFTAADFTEENVFDLVEGRIPFEGGTSKTENLSFSALITQQVGNVELYADLLVSQTDNKVEKPAENAYEIKSTNFYNPFGEDVIVDYLAEGLGSVLDVSDQERTNITLGVKFDIAGDWQADVALTLADESSFALQNGVLSGRNGLIFSEDADGVRGLPDTDGDGVLDNAFDVDTDGDGIVDDNMLSSSDPNVALNPFGALGSPQSEFFTTDLIGSVLGFNTNSVSNTFKAVFRGSTFELPGGTSQLAVGFEYRETALESGELNLTTGAVEAASIRVINPDFDPDLGESPENPSVLNVSETGQDVMEFFAEASLPVVGDNNSLPGVQSLLFTVAARYSEYDPDFSGLKYSNTSPRIGMRWGVNDEFTIRANWGESFRGPSVAQLASPVQGLDFDDFFGNPELNDFLRGLGLVGTSSGGNPFLQPEISTSTTLSAEWAPSLIEGLNLTATYTDIDFEDRIFSFRVGDLSQTQITALLDIPGIRRFVEADGLFFTTSGDTFFQGASNVAQRVSRSFDVGIAYDFDTDYGAFSASLNGTRTLELVDTPVFGAESTVQTGTDAAPSQWRARANLSWNRDNYGADLFVNYESSYTYRAPLFAGFCFDAFGCFVDENFEPVSQRIEPYTTYDLTGYYNFEDSGWRLLGGVVNLTNTGFPTVFTLDGPFDDSRVDLRGRIMYLEVKKNFDL